MRASFLSRSVVIAALVACFTVSAFAEDEKTPKKKKRGGRAQPVQSFFSANAQKALPGIRVLVSLSGEQRQQLVKIREEALGGEALQAAMKIAKDKNADRKDRRAANKTIKESKAAVQGKLLKALSPEQQKLVASINAAADAAASAIRTEYKQKIKDTKGDKAARQALTKELNAKVAASVKEKVASLLSDEQKAAVAEAAKNAGKKRARGKKKDGEERKKKRGKKKEGDESKKKRGKKKDKEAVS
jgi:hypothetical protein